MYNYHDPYPSCVASRVFCGDRTSILAARESFKNPKKPHRAPQLFISSTSVRSCLRTCSKALEKIKGDTTLWVFFCEFWALYLNLGFSSSALLKGKRSHTTSLLPEEEAQCRMFGRILSEAVCQCNLSPALWDFLERLSALLVEGTYSSSLISSFLMSVLVKNSDKASRVRNDFWNRYDVLNRIYSECLTKSSKSSSQAAPELREVIGWQACFMTLRRWQVKKFVKVKRRQSPSDFFFHWFDRPMLTRIPVCANITNY